MSRYDNRTIVKNDNEQYKDYFDDRGVKFINHYTLAKLKYPTDEQLNKLNIIRYKWKVEDKYWKLAIEHYNNQYYWWIIAWFNRKPTEAYVKAGDIIYIPGSLEQILEYLGV